MIDKVLKELETLEILDLVHVTQTLLGAIETKLTSTSTTEKLKVDEPPHQEISMEKLRALLAQYVSLDTNNRAKIKELLGAYGATKLSEVEATDYESMYKEVSQWLTQS